MSLVTSILTGGTNNHPTTSEEANYFATDFISDGVVGAVSNTSNLAPATGSFAPNAQDTPDMTISIASGALYVTATPSGQNSQVLRVTNSASANVTISANSSGSTKYDWVYLKIDATTANEPNLAGDDVASLVTSRSTSNTTDDGTPPTYGYCLAVVTVANGATSITDSNIRDKRVQSQVQDQTSSTGWVDLGNTLEYTSNDGNKQATYTVSGTDITDTIQEGMKVKLPRPTSVGTQCTDLEASSSQYASKSSPSGITFPDDFTCGAWVNVESIGTIRGIIARRDASTAGWSLSVNADGQVEALSLRIAGNFRTIQSYQTLPIGKWVHITASMDNSGGSYAIHINGVPVSTKETIAGTVTALVQPSTALVVGSEQSAGTRYFDGKIKHAFVADKVLSAAEVQEAMVSDDLTSASFSANLDAYFKLEGDFTDSSANGNDLTASGGAVATNADSPFSSTEYGIITSTSFSTDTTVAVDFGDKVPVNENVTAPSYSTHNVPYGFPIDTTEALREQQGTSGVVAFSAYGSSATTLTSGAYTTITYDTEDYDLGGNFASNTFTAPYNGVYKFTATNGVDSISDGKIVVVTLLVNSTLHRLGWSVTSTAATDRHCHTIARDFKLNAGDTVAVQVYHNYGSNRSSVSGETYSNFSGHLVART